MADVIFDIQFCQQGTYQDTSDIAPQLISWIKNSPPLTEKQLYLWSRRVDPKDAEMVIAELISMETNYLSRLAELEAELEEQKNENEKLRRENEMYRQNQPVTLQPQQQQSVTPSIEQQNSNVGVKEVQQQTQPTQITEKQIETEPPSSQGVTAAVRAEESQTTDDLSSQNTTPDGPVTPSDKKTRPRPMIQPLKRQGRQKQLLNVTKSKAPELNPLKWSAEDVSQWVAQQIGDKWKESFQSNHILGADLLEMSVEELRIIVDDDDASVCETLHSALTDLIAEGRERKQTINHLVYKGGTVDDPTAAPPVPPVQNDANGSDIGNSANPTQSETKSDDPNPAVPSSRPAFSAPVPTFASNLMRQTRGRVGAVVML